MIWTVLLNHLGHTLLRRGFKTFSHADDGSTARNQGRHLLKHTAKVVRGNGHENSMGVGHGLFETGGCGQQGIQIETCEVAAVGIRAINLIHDIRIARPQRDVSITTDQ